ncbi:MAG: cell filamentation protein Fic [Confluentimicrobium sp.]|mgnify:CR=1 FL=1|uniref:Fic family protein n=1 Tax=Actibacterium sp. TaxID=1872125 RepID=UPI000C677D07|nr:Fic family protein [Actibacterium sp.]MBC56904.1 cell filamentation protein Fic [Actibacterium sp.]|tara:strand:+ start:1788 stop:2936 length:1149 start_codon:yes stop_codon:yes gene_type:complete
MDVTLFNQQKTGKLVATIEGMSAFVPHPLPPEIELACLIDEFGETSAALGGLNRIGSTILNPYMVIRPLQRNEALRSSAMEGTFSTADNLAIVEALDSGSGSNADREVYNYIRAIDYAIDQTKTLPISHRVVKGMHSVLLSGATKARGANKRPGEYKIHQNWIGALDIRDARFIPPPPNEAIQCMDDLEAFINEDTAGLPALIAAGLVHYQFETIHPFGDGNGRVGRMLITLQLLLKGLLDAPLLYVSPYIERNKDEYIDAMFSVSSKGDWIRWLRYFLRAVKISSNETINTIIKLNELRDRYRSTIQQKTKSVSAITICDHLFERPVVSISDAAKVSETSYQSAKKNIDQLVKLGIISPVPGFENPKLFWSKAVIDISDGR